MAMASTTMPWSWALRATTCASLVLLVSAPSEITSRRRRKLPPPPLLRSPPLPSCPPEAIADYSPLSDESGQRSFTVTLTRPIKNGFAARLGGISTKEEADALKGVRLFAGRDVLPDLPDDEFYHADLIGLPVVTDDGEAIGTATNVMNFGATDIVEIAPSASRNGGKPFLVPLIPAAVPDWTPERLVLARAFLP